MRKVIIFEHVLTLITNATIMKNNFLFTVILFVFTIFLFVNATTRVSDSEGYQVYHVVGELVVKGKTVDGGYTAEIYDNSSNCEKDISSVDPSFVRRLDTKFLFLIDMSEDSKISNSLTAGVGEAIMNAIENKLKKVSLKGKHIKFKDKVNPKRFQENCIELNGDYKISRDTIYINKIIL